jgi:GntR family transcriptional regulator
MKALLQVDPAEAAPLWRQIEEGVRRLVASGGLSAGALMPSVRDLARDLGVNPNTVVKAYQHLVEAGVLAVRRGDGTYVADSPPAFRASERSALLREGALRYASTVLTTGAGLPEATTFLAAAWKSLKPPRAGGKS